MKQIKSLFMALTIMLSTLLMFNNSVYAGENNGISYEEFKQAQDDGYIGKEITYEDWNEIIKLNNQLEEQLENNDNFIKIYDTSEDINSNYQQSRINYIPLLQKGDILITNGTSSYGITGHAGIAVGNDLILHSPGKNEKETIHTDNREEFYDRYITKPDHKSWIKIYRPKNSTYGTKAANWAYNKYYGNKNVRYEINSNLLSFDTIYCSKLVWQAYRYGASDRNAFNDYHYMDGIYPISSNYYDLTSRIVTPYELDTMIKSTYEYNIDK